MNLTNFYPVFCNQTCNCTNISNSTNATLNSTTLNSTNSNSTNSNFTGCNCTNGSLTGTYFNCI